ncbi:S41 family peptidase [Flavobacterium sp. HJJ]|uniref:S41 family peptidase n=1 Tax=Flavobacterium sp. HJJ TaxID=2783792 RepID=UPI00188B1F04|nr:S41 family peptidase [Flavobacterium sp. HJJ]MBF4470534.1 hypothetical protein [Flavobacterium sp. HJJ]
MKIKFIVVITICLCFSSQIFSQEKQTVTDTEKYKQFGLVWGLMKYHHSEISKGKFNWDEVFVENVEKLNSVDTQKNLDMFLQDFISSIKAGKIKNANDTDDVFKKNQDYEWIEKYSGNDKLYTYLKQLKDNIVISDYYVSNNSLSRIPTFENEKGFKSFDYKIKSHRLLELFSFWNAVQYHYVNKYLMDKNWFSQLDSFVENFSNTRTQLEYELAKTKLIAHLNDSHAEFKSRLINDSICKRMPPFNVVLVNDTLVISKIYNKKLGEKDDLKLGDLIFEVRDKKIKSILKEEIAPILSFSNDSFLKRFASWIVCNKEDSIKVKVRRKDSIISKYIHLYKTFDIKDNSSLPFFRIEKKWQLIDDNVGYINLKTISKEEIKAAFEEFTNTDGIIIDLRNIPKNISENDITKYIYPDRKKFIKVLFPMVNRPSLANFDEPLISSVIDPFKSGRKNSKYYNKKIILLVNGFTQSWMEFMGMAIQASPNCITAGENTSGAVMNVAVFKMPDGTETNFTSVGAFYPDGTGAQRKGLKIDYLVKENTSNFNQDQYMIKGIELIKSAKK